MDDAQKRQLLFGTTAHRRPAAGGSVPAHEASVSETHRGVVHGEGNERELIEKSNDEKVDNLRGRVSEIRHLALDIGNEVRDQNEMLGGFSGTFDEAGDSVRRTIGLIRRLAGSGGGFHLCALFLFAFVFFVLVYLLLR